MNASNKLDKAVLQSINTDQGKNKSDGPGPLSKKEIEDLLKKGAYGALMDDDNAGDKVNVLFLEVEKILNAGLVLISSSSPSVRLA